MSNVMTDKILHLKQDFQCLLRQKSFISELHDTLFVPYTKWTQRFGRPVKHFSRRKKKEKKKEFDVMRRKASKTANSSHFEISPQGTHANKSNKKLRRLALQHSIFKKLY